MRTRIEVARRWSKAHGKVGRRLLAARDAAGLTQAQAARLLGVHADTLSKWERGEREPRPILAAAALAALEGAVDAKRSRPS